MKKIYLWLFACVLAVSLQSCGEDKSDVEILTAEYLKISHTVTDSPDGAHGVLRISSNCGWKIRKPDGVSIEEAGTGDAELDFTCPAATSLIRRDTITVVSASGRLKPYIVVAQYPTEEIIETDKDEMVFDNAGEVKLLAVVANTSWVIVSKDDWVSLSTLSDEDTKAVEVTAKPNPSGVARQSSITVRGKKGTEKVVTVYQRDLSQRIDISPVSITAKAVGGSYSLAVTGNMSWQASADMDWVSLFGTSGDGDGSISISVTPNHNSAPREAVISVKAYGITKTCTVKQEGGKAPEISNSSVDLRADKRSVRAVASVASEFDVTECGFCYSTSSASPSVNDSKASASLSASSTIDVQISGLSSGKVYYFRAYAKNVVGISYGDVHQITINGIPGENDNPLPDPK